jgi:hypothetical protein
MPFSTYAELKTAIIDELDRDDLTTKVDDFIDLAEALHRHGSEADEIPALRFRGMIRRSQLSATTRYVALPSGFLEMITLRILTDPVTVLREVNLHEMNRQRESGNNTPSFYTIHEEIEFDSDIADASPLTVEMIYYAELTALSDSNTSNALLNTAPGCYLYGALISAAPWLSEDERLTVWMRFYKGLASGLVGSDRRSRQGGPLFSAVAGGTP